MQLCRPCGGLLPTQASLKATTQWCAGGCGVSPVRAQLGMLNQSAS